MEEKLLSMLVELCDDDRVKEDLDMDLLASDLLDSLAIAELLFFIEDELGVIISPSEVDRNAMSTPRKIIALVKSRMEQ